MLLVNPDGSKKTNINWKAFKARKDQLAKLRQLDATRRKMWHSQKSLFEEKNRIAVQELLVKHQYTDETRPTAETPVRQNDIVKSDLSANKSSPKVVDQRQAFLMNLMKQKPSTTITTTVTTSKPTQAASRMAFLKRLMASKKPDAPKTTEITAQITTMSLKQTISTNVPTTATTLKKESINSPSKMAFLQRIKENNPTTQLVATTKVTSAVSTTTVTTLQETTTTGPSSKAAFLRQMMAKRLAAQRTTTTPLTPEPTKSANKIAFLKQMMAQRQAKEIATTPSTTTQSAGGSREEFLKQMMAKNRATQQPPTTIATTLQQNDKMAFLRRIMAQKRAQLEPTESSDFGLKQNMASKEEVTEKPVITDSSTLSPSRKAFIMQMLAKKRAAQATNQSATN